ncbi:MAG: M56 family peptidase [Gaiellales bacterium]|nr:MAG: M56 family peptidase [Gaiellales bacterium]
MGLFALAVAYFAILLFLSPWTIRRWLGNGIHPRTAALVHFISILVCGLATAAMLAMLLLLFVSGSLISSLEVTCQQVAQAGRKFLFGTPWGLPLMVGIAALVALQTGFFIAGGTRMVTISRRTSSHRRRASINCPALPVIMGCHGVSRICVILNTRDTIEAETVGLIRPRIYVSEGMVDMLSGEQLLAVLAHENAHRVGKDNLISVVARVITATMFCLPGIGSRYREMHICLEQAADLSAVNITGSPLVVAETLARISALTVDPRGVPVSSVRWSKSDMKARLEALISRDDPHVRKRLRIALLGVVTVLSLTLFSVSAHAAIGPEKRAAFICYFMHEHTEDGRCLSKNPNDTPEDIAKVCNHFKKHAPQEP